MAVEVLLMADVEKLGAEGDVVRVSDGYARNYLLPRKLAAPVTDATRRMLVKRQKEREVRRQSEVTEARALAGRIEKNSYTIVVKVGAEDKMFGSVTSADVAEALKQQGFDVDKRKVALDEPLRELGVYDVKVKLLPEVEATLKVWIVQE